jgi:squalene-associated FAD-dependent desaturase
MSSFDSVVIGGGFAGLSAAVAMAARGARVLVVEARPRLGGRAGSFVDQATGERVDNGQHVLFGCYRETFAFLGRIGAADRVRMQRSLEVPYVDRDGRTSTLRCPPLPPPLHLFGGILEWDALDWSERLAVLKLWRPLRLARRQLDRRDGAIAASPGETVERWLEMNGQGARIRELLWNPLALASLNQPPSEAAAPPFVRVLAEMFGGPAEAAAIGIPAVPLDELYAEPARAFIAAHGGEVRTSSPATVIVEPGGAAGIRAGADRIAAGAVVCAVPWHQLTALFPAGERPAVLGPLLERAAATASSPIVTVNLWFDRRVLETPFVGLPGRVMQWVFDKAWAFGDGASHLSLASSGAAQVLRRSNDELVRIATEEVYAAIPAARAAVLRRATVVREAQATFSVAPGQPSRPGTETPVARLLLAGDWIDTGLPGTIESAVVAGHRAAAAAGRVVP